METANHTTVQKQNVLIHTRNFLSIRGLSDLGTFTSPRQKSDLPLTNKSIIMLSMSDISSQICLKKLNVNVNYDPGNVSPDLLPELWYATRSPHLRD